MNSYSTNDYRSYLEHSWGKKPEQKAREKEYNHQYYEAHKNNRPVSRKKTYGTGGGNAYKTDVYTQSSSIKSVARKKTYGTGGGNARRTGRYLGQTDFYKISPSELEAHKKKYGQMREVGPLEYLATAAKEIWTAKPNQVKGRILWYGQGFINQYLKKK